MALAEQFDVHPNQISDWKQQVLDSASTVFEGSRKGKEPDINELHAKIGELTLEMVEAGGIEPRTTRSQPHFTGGLLRFRSPFVPKLDNRRISISLM